MASGALMNSTSVFAISVTSKDIPSMVDTRWTAGGLPLLQPEVQQQQQRPWIPADGRDAFISWLRAEFAAANAIIDSMCHHLQLIGKQGEYDFVLACIQQRRCNWNAVLHMQQYFSVAEVTFALQQVVLKKQQMQTFDHCNIYLPQVSPSIPEDRNTIHKTIVQRMSNQIHAHSAPSLAYQNSAMNGRDYHWSASGNQESKEIHNIVGQSNDITHENSKTQALNVSHVDAQSSPLQAEGPSNSNFNIPIVGQECKSDAHQTSGINKDFQDGKAPQASGEETEGTLSSKNLNGESYTSKQEEEIQTDMIKVTVEGVGLLESVFDKANSSQLTSSLYELEFVSKGGKFGGGCFVDSKKCAKTTGKKNIQFGSLECAEDDESKTKSGFGDENTDLMPPFLQQTVDSLIQRKIFSSNMRPDCCTVIVLDEEKKLSTYSRHYDLEKSLYMLALVSDCTVVFQKNPKIDVPGEAVSPSKLMLSVGSILVFQGYSASLVKGVLSTSSMKSILLLFGKLKSTKASKIAQPSPGFVSSAQSLATVGCTNAVSTVHAGMLKSPGPLPRPAIFLPPRNYPSVSISPVSRPLPPTQFTQSLASGPAGQAGPYPSMAITNTNWTPVPGPIRVHTNGTGVFLPSSGMSSSVIQPNNSPQIRQIFVPIPPLQKTISSPAVLSSLDSPESSNYSRHSSLKAQTVDILEGTVGKSASRRSLMKKELVKVLTDGKSMSDSQNPPETKFQGVCDEHSNSGQGDSSNLED